MRDTDKIAEKIKRMQPLDRWEFYEKEILPKIEKAVSGSSGKNRKNQLMAGLIKAAELWDCKPEEIRDYQKGDHTFIPTNIYESMFKASDDEYHFKRRQKQAREISDNLERAEELENERNKYDKNFHELVEEEQRKRKDKSREPTEISLNQEAVEKTALKPHDLTETFHLESIKARGENAGVIL